MDTVEQLKALENLKGTNTSMITIATKNIQNLLQMLKYEAATAVNIKSRV